MGVSIQEREFAFPLPFLLDLSLNGLDDAHSHWEEQIFFTLCTDSKVNLYQKFFHR